MQNFCHKSSKREAMWETDINGRIFLEKLCVRVQNGVICHF
jgi:hypothetical protein